MMFSRSVRGFIREMLILVFLMVIASTCLLVLEAEAARPIANPPTLFFGGRRRAAAASASAAASGPGPLELFISTIKEARKHLAAAAVARSVSIFSMYPVDTIKTRMQMGQANPLRLSGIYKGVAGSLVGQVPYGVLTFGSYEMYKKALLERFPQVRKVFLYAVAAILGDLTGSGWLCPSEVVKQQMQAGMFQSTGEALRTIWKTQGFAGLYQGYWGGVARDVPFRVAQLTSYEVTKNLYLKFKAQRRGRTQQQDSRRTKKKDASDEKEELSPIDAAVCGAIAGSFSAAITTPLDRIKTLLMTDSATYGGSVVSCASKIFRDEGLAGFVAGLAPRVTYIAPSVVIFFVAYEFTQQRLGAKGQKNKKGD